MFFVSLLFNFSSKFLLSGGLQPRLWTHRQPKDKVSISFWSHSFYILTGWNCQHISTLQSYEKKLTRCRKGVWSGALPVCTGQPLIVMIIMIIMALLMMGRTIMIMATNIISPPSVSVFGSCQPIEVPKNGRVIPVRGSRESAYRFLILIQILDPDSWSWFLILIFDPDS